MRVEYSDSNKRLVVAFVVTHIACARVDIFDQYEIIVCCPVVEHCGGKVVRGAGV
jgi:hypothetical protein